MRAFVLVAVLLGTACTRVEPLVSAPTIDRTLDMNRAAALVETGCLDCLLDAFALYDGLRADPGVAEGATLASIQTAALIGLRQRDLDMVDGGYLATARALAGATPGLPPALADLLTLAEALPAPEGMGVRFDGPQLLLRLRSVPGESSLADGAGDRGPLLAYVWLSIACHSSNARTMSPDAAIAALGDWQRLPLATFKYLTACRRPDAEALSALLAREPRFHEVHYDLGQAALGLAPDLNAAEAHYQQAYAWRQDWPGLTLRLANVIVTAEDFAGALTLYDRTLAMAPDQSEATLGRVRSLTYLARADEAMAAADRLLALARYPGDARYWRALNLFRQARYDEAWADIEVALTLLVNADVFKLAGIIAMHRGHPEVARRYLDEADTRNPDDCEIGYYRQVVLSDARDWAGAARVARAAGACFDAAEARMRGEIASVQVSDLTEHRRGLQVASREHQIAVNDRMRAVCWFNAAAAHFNLGEIDEARRLAALIVADERFGERAQELLSRERQ